MKYINDHYLKYFSKIKNIIVEKIEKEKKIKLIIPSDIKYLLNESTVKYGSLEVSILPEIKFGAPGPINLYNMIMNASKGGPYRKQIISNNKIFTELFKISERGDASRAGNLGENISIALFKDADGAENVNEFSASDNFPFCDIRTKNSSIPVYYSVKFYRNISQIKIPFNTFLKFYKELFEREILYKTDGRNNNINDLNIGLIVISAESSNTEKKIIISKWECKVEDIINSQLAEFTTPNQKIIYKTNNNNKNFRPDKKFFDVFDELEELSNNIKSKNDTDIIKLKDLIKSINTKSNLDTWLNKTFETMSASKLSDYSFGQFRKETNNILIQLKPLFTGKDGNSDFKALDIKNTGIEKFINIYDVLKTGLKIFFSDLNSVLNGIFNKDFEIDPTQAPETNIKDKITGGSGTKIEIILSTAGAHVLKGTDRKALDKGDEKSKPNPADKSSSGAYRKVANDTANAIKSYIDDVRTNTNITNKDQEFQDRVNLVKNFNKIQKILKNAFQSTANKNHDILPTQIDKVDAAATYIDNLDGSDNVNIEFEKI